MIHFISGLPRAGSTLLASLLRQNPEFHAHIQSPLGHITTALVGSFSQFANESALFASEEQRIDMLRGVFAGYYKGCPPVVFDSNRRWTAHLALLDRLFPGCKVICCVRPVAEIIDSFERLFQRDPTQISTVLSTQNTTLANRVGIMMAPDAVVGFSHQCLQDAYFGPYRHMLAILQFDHLVTDPLRCLKDLHKTLDLPWFSGYDPTKLQAPSGVELFDAFLGTPGLHTVRRRVDYVPQVSHIPAALARTLPRPFWINESITKDA